MRVYLVDCDKVLNKCKLKVTLEEIIEEKKKTEDGRRTHADFVEMSVTTSMRTGCGDMSSPLPEG